MEIVEFNIGKHRREGELVKKNNKTVLVKLRSAGKVRIIKRHLIKHGVRYDEA